MHGPITDRQVWRHAGVVHVKAVGGFRALVGVKDLPCMSARHQAGYEMVGNNKGEPRTVLPHCGQVPLKVIPGGSCSIVVAWCSLAGFVRVGSVILLHCGLAILLSAPVFRRCS